MSDEHFTHVFGGWKKAHARRWTNPDGSVGGIVAVDAVLPEDTYVPESSVVWPGASIGSRASIGDGASIGNRASIGDGASIGYDASIGSRASIGYGDWHLSGSPCGSRSAMWTAAYSREYGLRWWVGCKCGITSNDLRKMVTDTHGNGPHADDYMAAISFVESHPGLARAKAKDC